MEPLIADWAGTIFPAWISDLIALRVFDRKGYQISLFKDWTNQKGNV